MCPFYGKEIDPDREQAIIQKILSQYRRTPVSEELKKKIHDELSAAKEKGVITIPFKVVMRGDQTGIRLPYIEVILDTKV